MSGEREWAIGWPTTARLGTVYSLQVLGALPPFASRACSYFCTAASNSSLVLVKVSSLHESGSLT